MGQLSKQELDAINLRLASKFRKPTDTDRFEVNVIRNADTFTLIDCRKRRGEEGWKLVGHNFELAKFAVMNDLPQHLVYCYNSVEEAKGGSVREVLLTKRNIQLLEEGLV